MSQTNQPQAVLVTGASSGIGKAATRLLHHKGFTVFAGVRQEKDAAALKDQSKGRIIPVILDVTLGETISRAVNQIEAHTGGAGLHGLVNNAGVPFGGPSEYLDLDQVRQVLEVNLIGAMAVTQGVLPLLRQARGRVVNISSISGRIALPFVSPYAASKFGLEAFSDALRVELKPWKIPVSVIEPGDIETPIWEKTVNTISKAIEALPQSAHDMYGPVFEKIDATTIHGISPYHVAEKIFHALSAKRPRPRYVVGIDAKIMVMIARLPTPIRDWIITLFLPKYG